MAEPTPDLCPSSCLPPAAPHLPKGHPHLPDAAAMRRHGHFPPNPSGCPFKPSECVEAGDWTVTSMSGREESPRCQHVSASRRLQGLTGKARAAECLGETRLWTQLPEGLVGHPGRGVREAGGGAGMEIVPNNQGQAHKYGALVWYAGCLRRSSTEPWGPNPQRNQQLRWGNGGPRGPRHMEGMYAGGRGERPCEGFRDASTRRSQAWLSGLAAQGSCGPW